MVEDGSEENKTSNQLKRVPVVEDDHIPSNDATGGVEETKSNGDRTVFFLDGVCSQPDDVHFQEVSLVDRPRVKLQLLAPAFMMLPPSTGVG